MTTTRIRRTDGPSAGAVPAVRKASSVSTHTPVRARIEHHPNGSVGSSSPQGVETHVDTCRCSRPLPGGPRRRPSPLPHNLSTPRPHPNRASSTGCQHAGLDGARGHVSTVAGSEPPASVAWIVSLGEGDTAPHDHDAGGLACQLRFGPEIVFATGRRCPRSAAPLRHLRFVGPEIRGVRDRRRRPVLRCRVPPVGASRRRRPAPRASRRRAPPPAR